MHFVFGLLGDLLFGWLWWLIPEEIDRRRDRKRLLQGEVRCSIRAVENRVLNIGTEWSGGLAHFAPKTLRFVPSIGIVGERVVTVHSIRRAPTPNAFARGIAPLGGAAGGIGASFIIETTGGELMVNLPSEVAEEVAAVLVSDEAGTGANPRAS